VNLQRDPCFREKQLGILAMEEVLNSDLASLGEHLELAFQSGAGESARQRGVLNLCDAVPQLIGLLAKPGNGRDSGFSLLKPRRWDTDRFHHRIARTADREPCPNIREQGPA